MTKPVDVFSSPTHKGGVGKSFTLRLLYQALVRVLELNGEDRKILVIDCDPQANSSERWLPMESETRDRLMGKLPPIHPELEGERSDITDIWLQRVTPMPYATANPKIDIVPAREVAMDDLAYQPDKFHLLGIRQWLQQPEIAEEYCAVFIDTPPSKGLMTQAALAATTQVFVPVKYEQHPISGMDAMLHLIDSEMMSRTGGDYPDLNFLGIVANDVPSSNATIYSSYKQALLDHPSYGRLMLPVELKHLAAFTETDAKTTLPGDIFDYPSKSHAHVLRSAEAFCRTIFERVPQFSSWNLDFRSGVSFDPDAEVVYGQRETV